MVLARRLDTSRTRAATLIATGGVQVGGRAQRASYLAQPGDSLVVDIPAPPGRTVLPEAIPLAIVYEDAALLVVDKPAGMVVHPAPGHWSGTLVNALVGRESVAASGGPIAGAEEPPRAGIVHRLDKDTSGLLLVAKTDRAHRALTTALAARRVRRRYAALAWGHLRDDRLTIEAPIGRDPRDRKRMAVVASGRPARTDLVRLARFDAVDLLRAQLHTGRTHQIRVHLASIGHPVVGDETYAVGGRRRVVGLSPRRHFLHAAWLALEHPLTGELLDFRSPLPADLRASLAVIAGPEAGPDAGDLTQLGFYGP